jgi:uncharacterized surface protein with fasciclin (FAS1) repeats
MISSGYFFTEKVSMFIPALNLQIQTQKSMQCKLLSLLAGAALVGFPLSADAGASCPEGADKSASATLMAKSKKAQGTIVDVASGQSSFKTLTSLLKTAGLVETLQGTGPFTVFAPTDEAFAALPQATLADLQKPENRDKLRQILTYHVVPGKVTANQIKPGPVNTVEGQAVTLSTAGGVKVNNAKVVKADVMTSNGVIHVIDQVLLPSS